MTNWREYEEIEEEFNKIDRSPKTKKKKTWKQINEEKQRQVTKKQWQKKRRKSKKEGDNYCLLYTSPSPRDGLLSRMPSSA